jgi:serine/threonine protein kinase
MKKRIENYSFRQELGSGAYSKVYLAVNVNNNEEVAIKMVRAEKIR